MTERTEDHVRVLAGLSGLVVGAVLDEEAGAASDPFADALRRYQEDGAPDVPAPWRGAPAASRAERASAVLRRLTRDLLKGVSMPEPNTATTPEPGSDLPENVRPIEAGARDVPALELASDGTWKPSSSALSSQEEIDAGALRRNVPGARSRYPEVRHAGGLVLPSAPKS